MHNKLVREKDISYDLEEEFTSPCIVHNVMTRLFGMDKKAEEYMYLIALNTKCYPLGFFEISHGTVNTTIASPREIFIRAILTGASCIIICHNHPSKNPAASSEDIEVTKRI
jgi:DNA repair protein RadC